MFECVVPLGGTRFTFLINDTPLTLLPNSTDVGNQTMITTPLGINGTLQIVAVNNINISCKYRNQDGIECTSSEAQLQIKGSPKALVRTVKCIRLYMCLVHSYTQILQKVMTLKKTAFQLAL